MMGGHLHRAVITLGNLLSLIGPISLLQTWAKAGRTPQELLMNWVENDPLAL